MAELCLSFCLRTAAPYRPSSRLLKHGSDVLPILVSECRGQAVPLAYVSGLEKERVMKVSKCACTLSDQLSQRTLSEHKPPLKQERLSDRPAAIKPISIP